MLLEVFHITKKERLPSIINWWLKTLKLLWEDWIIDLPEKLRRECSKSFYPQNLIDFRINTLYFTLDEPPNYSNWISIIIDTDKEEVLNNSIEYQGYDIYMKSRMKLAEFLERSKWIDKLHPISAFPIWDDELDPIWNISEYQLYSPEIVIFKNCIKEFVRVNLWS